MTAIKEIPTNFRVYFTSLKNTFTQKKESTELKLFIYINQKNKLHKEIVDEYGTGKQYKIDLYKYTEFECNKYIDGTFYKVAKGYFIDKKDDYKFVPFKYNVYKLASLQKDIYDLQNTIEQCNKVLNVTLTKYTDLLKVFYNKVHEEMICNGRGISFGKIGWTCINRCKVVNPKPKIDYQKTKENKAKLLAEGKTIYNKQDAEWCKANGIKYDGVDGRVFRNEDYVYEIPLLHCLLPNGNKHKLTISNYYGRSVRGKSNKELIELCNYDKQKICNLDLDLRAKLELCLTIDKILYSKFIRNENQQPSTFRKIDR